MITRVLEGFLFVETKHVVHPEWNTSQIKELWIRNQWCY